MKRARYRRRPNADLENWRRLFACGHDYLRELDGDFRSPCWHEDPAKLRVARDAWKRFGAEFMAHWRRAERPWARSEFGEPWHKAGGAQR